MQRSVRLLWLATLAVPLGVAAVLSLLWPGPLALDDRIPLFLLFGIPAVVFADRMRTELD